MDVAVVTDERFSATHDGRVWGSSTYQVWARYLLVFDRVSIVARVSDADGCPRGASQVDGDRVAVARVPHYAGLRGYLQAAGRVRRVVRNSILGDCAVILKAGSNLADVAFGCLRPMRRPYAVEVVGDPFEVFGPGVVDHPLRPLLRFLLTRRQRRHCRGAIAAAYVTARALQERYPCPHYTVGVSDVQLPAAPSMCSDRIAARIVSDRGMGPFRIVTVGSLAQRYKGTDVLIRALAMSVRDGLDATLTIVGDGQYRPELERLTGKLGLRSKVSFSGCLAGPDAVAAVLDESDLFVLASRTEGLPRALLEAMSRGLPCIASAVGGVPELLPATCLVPAGDVSALHRRLMAIAREPASRLQMSRQNRQTARGFEAAVLRPRWTSFYGYVYATTEEWLRSTGPAVEGRFSIAE